MTPAPSPKTAGKKFAWARCCFTLSNPVHDASQRPSTRRRGYKERSRLRPFRGTEKLTVTCSSDKTSFPKMSGRLPLGIKSRSSDSHDTLHEKSLHPDGFLVSTLEAQETKYYFYNPKND